MIGISIQIHIQEATPGKSLPPALISEGSLMLYMLVYIKAGSEYIKARERVDWLLAFVAASFNLVLSDKYGCIFFTVLTSDNRQDQTGPDKVPPHWNRVVSSPLWAISDENGRAGGTKTAKLGRDLPAPSANSVALNPFIPFLRGSLPRRSTPSVESCSSDILLLPPALPGSDQLLAGQPRAAGDTGEKQPHTGSNHSRRTKAHRDGEMEMERERRGGRVWENYSKSSQ